MTKLPLVRVRYVNFFPETKNLMSHRTRANITHSFEETISKS
jgi:hypothetical protein